MNCLKSTIIILFGWSASSAFSEKIFIHENTENSSAWNMNIIETDPNKTSVEIFINYFEWNQQQISVDDLNSIRELGFPELPKLNKLFMIPKDAKPTVKIISSHQQTYNFGELALSRGELDRNESKINSLPKRSALKKFPYQMLETSQPFLIHETRGINLEFHPFQYDLISNDLLVTHSIKFEISNTVADENKFFNEQGDILIIYHDNFESDLQDFILWKKQLGHQVYAQKISTIGATHQEIKKFIQNFYEQNKKLTFVILLGDSELLPYHIGTVRNARDNPADPMYSLVSGDDSYPDLIVGRMSVKNSQELQTILTKTINYEKKPDRDGGWYKKASGFASDEGFPSDAERAEKMRLKLIENNFYDEVDQLYLPDALNRDLIADVINEGRSFVNYIGHGLHDQWNTLGTQDDSLLKNDDLEFLHNGMMLPVIINAACLIGSFDHPSSDSFAERWLKVGSVNEPKGAIAVFAASTNQAWTPPTIGQNRIVDLLLKKQIYSVGALMMNASIAVLEDNSFRAEETFQTWHIFGDPSLILRTDLPSEIQETHEVKKLDQHWSVTVSTGESHITASITLDKKLELLASGVTDENGNIELMIPKDLISDTNKPTLTLSGVNKVPIQLSLDL